MITHRTRAMVVSSIVIIAVIALVAVIHYTSTNVKENVTSMNSNTAATSTVSGLTIQDKKIIDQDKKAGYKITAIYPNLIAGASEDSKIKINHAISDQVSAVIDDFKKGSIDSLATASDEESTLDINYEVAPTAALKNILSLRLIETSYDAGAAHPGHVIDTLNFDTSTGLEIHLVSLFDLYPESALKRLSDYTSAELKKKLGTDQNTVDGIDQGTIPTDDNFGSFQLTDSGILFIFQEYQVAPYAAGEQEVLVPYAAIKDMIRKDGPLSSLFK